MLTKEELESVRVSAEWLMGRIHVGTPDEEIVADANRRMDLAAEKGLVYSEGAREQIIEIFLEAHRANQQLYTHVMGGRR